MIIPPRKSTALSLLVILEQAYGAGTAVGHERLLAGGCQADAIGPGPHLQESHHCVGGKVDQADPVVEVACYLGN
ncbi:MAG: hypothetical protein JXK93_12155 [Sphaerochaetaceae bacterium]|nr:hypothetical protein [Sphaerochaetaceae bacterium]